MVRKIFLLFFCTFSAVCLSAQQQEIEVRGRVVDDNGEPLKGEVWTYERLQKSYVLIDNFVLNDYQEISESDIYYNLVAKSE